MLRVQWVVQRVALIFLLFVASGSSLETVISTGRYCPWGNPPNEEVLTKAVCDQHAAQSVDPVQAESTFMDANNFADFNSYPNGCIFFQDTRETAPYPTTGEFFFNSAAFNSYPSNAFAKKVCTVGGSSGASGDPHIKLAYGGSADFRGQNDSEYRIFAASTWHVDAKITEMTYMPFQGHRACGIKLINGTYFTKAILTVIGPDGVIRVGKIVPNWTGMHVTGDVEPSYRASRSARFDLPDGTELHFSQGWNHNKAAPGVPQHHLDIKLTASENTEMCGLIGSSFDGTGEPRFGPSDDYCVLNKNGVATTKAQGEGVYDHPMSDYEILAGVEMPCSMAWKKTHMAA